MVRKGSEQGRERKGRQEEGREGRRREGINRAGKDWKWGGTGRLAPGYVEPCDINLIKE